jgi:hypothetical protein
MDKIQTNGKMLARGLVLALALLILPLSGMASAEASATKDASAVDKLDLGLDAVVVDAADLNELDELDLQALELADAVSLSDSLSADHLDLRDIEAVDENEVTGVLVIVDTDGHIAWITVVVFYEDGSVEVDRYGPMRYSQMRERLANYDGRLIVNWFDAPVDPAPGCPGGLLAGQLNVNDDGTGSFRGQVMNADGDVIGHIWGDFGEGQYHGQFSARGGDITGVLRGLYSDGAFKGQWSSADADIEGVMAGHYKTNETGESGVFRGKWKMDCSVDEEIEPRPVPIDVQPISRKPMLKQLDDVMDKPVLETESGGVINVGDAAAGSTLGTIALLGAGFLRRRITGGI